MSKIFFTADLHLGHRHILDVYSGRPCAGRGDIAMHDEFIIRQWNESVGRHDEVYILGDFSLRPASETRRILERLNGRKYLCPGNHDSSLKSLGNYFVKVEQIMTVRFRPSRCPWLDSDISIVLCHYPLLEWDGMSQGVVHLHGHCHGMGVQSDARRLDVGYDATGRILLPLEDVVSHFRL